MARSGGIKKKTIRIRQKPLDKVKRNTFSFNVAEQGRIEEHFEYVGQNHGALTQDYVGRHEYLSEYSHAVIDASHNKSSPHHTRADCVGNHQMSEGHVGD